MAYSPSNSTCPEFTSTPVSSSSRNQSLPDAESSCLRDSLSDVESATDIETSVEDRTEEDLTERFIKDGCDCSINTPKCSDTLTKQAIIK